MRVSVILPVFNRAELLRRCVESVRAQTFADWEIVAVDDASSDDSVAALETFRDPRIRILRHETNRGPSAARNTAIAAARGELFALLDSDDEWLPGKLAAQLAVIDRCEACGCEYWLVEDGAEKHVHLPEPASWSEVLHTRCELGNGTTLLVRRDCAEAIGAFDERLRVYEDWDWVLRLVTRFRYEVVREPLARVHAGGPRSARGFAEGAEVFLQKHDAAFAQRGDAYRRRIRAKHLENIAANAFANREYRMGARYLIRSFAAFPRQSPVRLGALLLAPIDAVFGTSLVQRAAAWRRSRSQRSAIFTVSDS
jgi:glycosyltransferase involved in cell wall biosynthesis